MMEARQRTLALRGIVYGLVIAWLWKIELFAQMVSVYRARALTLPLFPQVLQSLTLLSVAYVMPLLLALAALLLPRLDLLAACLGGFVAGSALLLCHGGSYNDATFVTSLWVSLIGLWLHRACRSADNEVPARAAFLTQLLIGMLFCGGFVGKLTPGYLDGSVMYDLYFADRDYWPFELLRSWLNPPELRTAAHGYSLFVLAVEAALASLPLWPTRPALPMALVAPVGLAVMSNPLLGSVVASLIALGLASLWLTRQQQHRPDDAAPHATR